jgi:hypothetical protein
MRLLCIAACGCCASQHVAAVHRGCCALRLLCMQLQRCFGNWRCGCYASRLQMFAAVVWGDLVDPLVDICCLDDHLVDLDLTWLLSF